MRVVPDEAVAQVVVVLLLALAAALFAAGLRRRRLAQQLQRVLHLLLQHRLQPPLRHALRTDIDSNQNMLHLPLSTACIPPCAMLCAGSGMQISDSLLVATARSPTTPPCRMQVCLQFPHNCLFGPRSRMPCTPNSTIHTSPADLQHFLPQSPTFERDGTRGIFFSSIANNSCTSFRPSIGSCVEDLDRQHQIEHVNAAAKSASLCATSTIMWERFLPWPS